jgi:type I restriction enzyme S subunit
LAGELDNPNKPYILQRQGTEVPDSWKIFPIGELLELEYGTSLPEKEREDGPYPVFGSNGRSGQHSEYHVEAPGIIVGRKGVNLGIEWSDADFNVIDTAYHVNSDSLNVSNVELRFLYYNFLDFDLDRLKSGSAVPGLNRDEFYEETIALPPIEEQKKIATILTNIDKKININQRANKLLEELEQTVFRSWFVDFDPYDELKDSEIGMIPEEFEIRTISEFAEIILGNSPKSEHYNEDGEGLPFFQGSKNFGLRYPEVERWCTKRKKVAEEDDVLISIRAPVGDVNRAERECVVGRGVTALRMNKFGNEYLYHLLKANKKNWEKYKSGTTFNSINKTDIQNFPVAFPPDEEIEKFNSLTEPMREMIEKNVNENQDLLEIRNTLLPKLMSGEIRVNDINLEDLEVSSEV